MRFDAADWDRALDALRNAPELVVACHVNPDGDAVGSLLGATLALRSLGKSVHATWDGAAAGPPASYSFLPGMDSVVAPADVPVAETFLALDCGAGNRLGELEPIARKADVLVNVDHHPGNDNFGTLNVVVPTASSTAELVAALIEDLGAEFDRDIATCLYTGLVTDTGRFQFSNASPDAHRLAAALVARGVPVTDIARDVYESASFSDLQLLGRILQRAVLREPERFVYSWITLADLEETGVPMDATDTFIDAIRGVREADVAAMLKEQLDGTYRVSMRSKGARSVGAIARARGGGGHELAAGFTAADKDSAIEDIARALQD